MRWQVKRIKRVGTAKMSCGRRCWDEPSFLAVVYLDGQEVGSVGNSSLLCLPSGNVRAPEATDKQIAAAVIGDEHVYDCAADGRVAQEILSS